MSGKTDMTPEKLLEVFFSRYPEEHYKRGACMLCSDEEPRGMYFVQSGYVRQYATKHQGEQLNLHVYRRGAVVPLMWLFNETSNRYNYEIMKDSIIRCAPKEAFMTFLDKHPELLEHFVRKLLLGIDGLLARMESLVLDDAYTKTVLLFLYMSNAFGKEVSGEIVINIPLTHKQVASWIGTARETASLMVEKLRKEKLITWRTSRYYIPDVRALELRAQQLKDASSES